MRSTRVGGKNPRTVFLAIINLIFQYQNRNVGINIQVRLILILHYLTRFNLSIVKLTNKVIKMKYTLSPQQMQITSGHIKLTIKYMQKKNTPMTVKSIFASRLFIIAD